MQIKMEMNQVDYIVKQEKKISNAMKYFVTIIITYTNTRKLKTYRLISLKVVMAN